MAQRLTDRTVKALKAPNGKYKITYGGDIPGFGVRVTKSGVKSFILNYAIHGRERRYTIGKYPAWSVAAAREQAGNLRQAIDRGNDPMGDRKAKRNEPTVGDLCDRYMADHARAKKRESSADADEFNIGRHVRPALGRRKVSTIEHGDIDKLFRDISTDAPITANRVAALLSKMFALAIRWQYRADNPAKGIERNQEKKRHRYMTADEMRRLTTALAEYPYIQKVRASRAEALATGQKWRTLHRDKPAAKRKQSCDAIRLLMLTGARKGETLKAQWDQFDLDAGTWTKPGAATKQKTDHRIPLSAPALALLSKMPDDDKYLFPDGEGGHQRDIKKAWTAICERAEIEDLRIHDLRHSYASQLASAGLSLPIIGALLGHTQPQTTARYSHLQDDPLREATERVGAAYTSAETGERADVIEIGGSRG